ncbi:MAG: sensor domain-containing diguanylate cyclase [Sandaracinus sp.]
MTTGLDVERELLAFVDELRGAHDLDTAVNVVTRSVTRLLGTDHASLRLLDDSRTNLLLAARTGRSLHGGTDAPFVKGEGLVGWVVAHGTALRVGSAPSDARWAMRPGRSTLVSFLGAPLADDEGCFGVLATTSPLPDRFDERDELRLRLMAALAAPTLEVHRLRRIAITDSLTGLLNRHALEHVLPDADDPKGPRSAVILLDIDHFKDVNDRHGHPVGDRVLVDLARVLRASVRTEDRIVRYGGEEILVILPAATTETAHDAAERVRSAVSRTVSAEGEAVSISAGVALRHPGEPRDELIARADAALYEAKRTGRNRTSVMP